LAEKAGGNGLLIIRYPNGYWRVKTYQEINEILKGQNIIGFINKQRLNWLGYVERVAEDNIVQEIKCQVVETHVYKINWKT